MEFFPETQKMYCIYCGSTYSLEELNMQSGGEEKPELSEVQVEREREKEIRRRHATIQMQILHCNACGAELAVNGVEASALIVGRPRW